MEKRKISVILNDIAAKVASVFVVYAFVAGCIGLAIFITKWILRMVGVL